MTASSAVLLHPNPLPAVLTPVLGREAELDHVLALIDDPATRLITVTGPGGVGKTRLALHLAATLIDEFERDVVYVPLAAIRDPDLVLPTIGQALEVSFDGSEGWEDRLVRAIEGRSPLLLALDNFEQLLGAAPDIASLLARCPGATMLITSQAALAIPGEQLYPLRPLPTPDPEQVTAEAIMRTEAALLFVARAQAVKPGLAVDDRMAVTIAEICRRLDGLPLAIELAAARMNILSPDALLARLSNRLQVLRGERRGVPDRLRTMRHAIAWSYELLAPEEQAVFRRMSVFMGGFSLDAVEALFEEANDGRDAWTVLSTLVDHSLVQATSLPSGDGRYLMLETLRDYGLDQLEELGEAEAARLAHATWVRELAETAEPHIFGSEQEVWLNRLEPEWENVRTAMEWALLNGREEFVLRTLSATRRFCTSRGHHTESRRFLDRALIATGAEQNVHRCRGLIAAGNHAEDQGDTDVAKSSFEQAQALANALGDKTVEAQALIGLGYVAHDSSDYETALSLHDQAATIAREIDDQRSLGFALSNLASVSYYQGNLVDAERFWEEAGAISKLLGDHLSEAIAFGNLGAVAVDRGEYDRAEKLQRRALELQRTLGNAPNIAYALVNLADISCHLGDYALANDLLGEAIPILRETGYKLGEGVALHHLADVSFGQGDMSRAASALLESVQLLAAAGDQFSIAGNIDLLAQVCAAGNDHETAIELMGAAAALRDRLGSAPSTIKRAELDALEKTLRQAVSLAVYKRHWLIGKTLDFDAVVRRVGIVARQIVGPRQPRPVLPEPDLPESEHNLTNREIEVLRLLTEGRSTREISDTMFISPRTATTHINNIFGKLEVNSRAAAVAWAMRSGVT